MNNEHKKTFLALGDSYTVGELVETSQRWTMQLSKLLLEKSIPFHLPVTIAHTGATSGELLLALEQLKPTGKFDLVSLLIGVNNQYRGYSVVEYEKEFETLLNSALNLSHKKSGVIIISIPDWSFSSFGESDKRGAEKISEEIKLFNSSNKKIADKYGVNYADITPFSMNHDVSFFAVDGLHPSGKQYKLWADLIFEKVYRSL
jgi:lysophospholipase L1-like esterase